MNEGTWKQRQKIESSFCIGHDKLEQKVLVEFFL